MIKRKITEIIEQYDEKGLLVKKTTTITEEDDNTYCPTIPNYPYRQVQPIITCSLN